MTQPVPQPPAETSTVIAVEEVPPTEPVDFSRWNRGHGKWPPMSYWARLVLTIVAVLVGCVMFYRVRAVVASILLGLFLAVGLEPMVNAMVRRGIRRGWAILIEMLGVLAFVAGLIYLALRPAIKQLSDFLGSIPGWYNELMIAHPEWQQKINEAKLNEKIGESLGKLPDLLTTSLGQIWGFTNMIIGLIFSILTIVVLMIYFQLALPKLRKRAEQMLGHQERIDLLEEVLGKISGYVVGQMSICLIAGFSAFVFLTIIDAPFPALMGLLTALFSAVPIVGATIGAVLVSLVALTDSWQKAVGTMVFFLIYQQIENYVISPRVFSRAINVPAAVVFVSVLIGSSLAGFLGAIVALPTAAAIKSIWQYRIRMKGVPTVDEIVGDDPDDPPRQKKHRIRQFMMLVRHRRHNGSSTELVKAE